MKRRAKPKNHTLTPKRVEVLRFINKHQNCLVGFVAQEMLANPERGRRGLWSQAATRMGAGYCKTLEAMGLVSIHSAEYGFGTVRLTSRGAKTLMEIDEVKASDSQSLAAVLERCIE